MAETPRPWHNLPPNVRVTETILLVVANSDLHPLMGSSAMRDLVLRQRDALMPTPHEVRLQPLWTTLSVQPGFSAEKSYAPLCKLQTFEALLSVSIELPAALSTLDEAARSKLAARCPVEASDVVERLNAVASGGATNDAPVRKTREKKPLTAAGILTVVGLAIATIGAIAASMYLTFFVPSGQDLATDAIATDIPLASARRYENAATAVLSDASWLQKPEAERRVALEAALARVAQQGMDRVVLQDATGAVRAIAIGEGGRLSLVFP